MPEAVAIVLVFVISVGIYIAAVVKSRDPALHEPGRERVRAEQEIAWLGERLMQARREGWDAEMVRDLENRITAARAGRK